MTQKDVATAMETTQSAVSDFERGSTDPSQGPAVIERQQVLTTHNPLRAAAARISGCAELLDVRL